MNFTELIAKVREVVYDRFPTPILYIKRDNSAAWRIATSNPAFLIMDFTVSLPVIKMNIPFEVSGNPNNMGLLFDSLLEDIELYSVASTFAFNRYEPLSSLLPSAKRLDQIVTIFKRNFYSDLQILERVNAYFIRYRKVACKCVNTENVEALLTQLPCGSEDHLVWWVAYYLIEQRRVMEMAQSSIEISFTNDEAAFCGGFQQLSIGRNDYAMDVKVADVFTLKEKKADPYQSLDISKVGVENLFGDNGFWWKYQNHLRMLIERTYGDYSLRLNQVVQSQMILAKDHSFNEYFPSFPYTYFPDARNVSDNQGCQ